MLTQGAQIRPRRIESPIGLTKDKENDEVDPRYYEHGNESRNHARKGLRLRSSGTARVARVRGGEVILQPTDEISHDCSSVTVILNYVEGGCFGISACFGRLESVAGSRLD
jgi:hypothetical protein